MVRPPFTAFVVILGLSTTIGTITLTLTAAGEEIGWRGYMLTRLIDSGVPRPVLVSGLLWGLWHVAGTLTGVYATGRSPVLSAVFLMVTITSLSYVIGRMRLETGSVWPAIAVHAAWNSIIVGAFDSATTGAGAALWVGESGVLTALTLVVAAFLFSRGRWTVRRRPEAQRDSSTSSPA
jgi:membrane protease YdiL (CAAX protease family)